MAQQKKRRKGRPRGAGQAGAGRSGAGRAGRQGSDSSRAGGTGRSGSSRADTARRSERSQTDDLGHQRAERKEGHSGQSRTRSIGREGSGTSRAGIQEGVRQDRHKTGTRRSNERKKIKKYRKPLNLNVGILVFLIVFVYVVFYVIMYLNTSHIVRYEVQEGSLAIDNICKAVVIRDEIVVNAENAGYVNYYIREGERAALGDLVYTVDETGKFMEELEKIELGENSLSDRELLDFRTEIVNFVHSFDPADFSSVYDFKYNLKGTVLKLASANMMKNIDSVNGLTSALDFCRAPDTGIVAYWTDNYESLTPDMVTAELLEAKDYEKKQLVSSELVEAGQPVYKLSTNENWSIVVQLPEERAVQLEEEGYVKVRFLKNQYESWGAVKMLHGSDGNTFVQLSFTNSMLTFVSDRFLEVELIWNDKTGLKIPVSSIVEKEFFLVPEGYVTQGGDNSKDGVIRQSYLEDGTISSEFVETSPYSFDEENHEYFMDSIVLSIGDILIKPDSQETYTVSRKASLIGVYNMNKGYADFKEINILSQNEEYAIVQSNTKYGLNVYDYIVLNADTVSDDQFIYE